MSGSSTLAPALNNKLIDQVLDHITADPNSWRQSVWGRQTECGTSHCFAGWTAALSAEVSVIWIKSPLDSDTRHLVMAGVTDQYGIPRDVMTWAAHKLGFTEREAALVFFKMTERPSDMRRLIEGIRAARTSSTPAPWLREQIRMTRLPHAPELVSLH